MQGFIARTIPLVLRRAGHDGAGADRARDRRRTRRDALVLSQVVLSFGIPFALVPLVLLTRRRDIMGALVNRRLTTVVALARRGADHRAERLPARPDVRRLSRLRFRRWRPRSPTPSSRSSTRCPTTGPTSSSTCASPTSRATSTPPSTSSVQRAAVLEHDWHWRILVAHRFGHAAAAPAVHGALRLLDDAGIAGELARARGAQRPRRGHARCGAGPSRPCRRSAAARPVASAPRSPQSADFGRMIAVVTGASSGIGEATVRRLAAEPGARLVLVARREDRLRALAEEIGGATVVAVDLTDDDAPARVREAVEREHDGRLDLLVNNAGAPWTRRSPTGGWENVRRTMALNFDAQVRLTEALLPLLRACAPVVDRQRRLDRRPRRARAAAAPTRPASSRSPAGPTRCTWRSSRTACTSGSCCPASSRPRASRRRCSSSAPRRAGRWRHRRSVAEAIMDAGPGGTPSATCRAPTGSRRCSHPRCRGWCGASRSAARTAC